MASNPFNRWLADPAFSLQAGSDIDPFGALRQTLGKRLFNAAGVFGDQGAANLSGQGRFDPNLAAAIRQRAFGQASMGLSTGLADLAGQEGQFREGQREFNTKNIMELLQSSEEWQAAQPNFWTYLTAGTKLLSGVGSLATGLGAGGLGWTPFK